MLKYKSLVKNNSNKQITMFQGSGKKSVWNHPDQGQSQKSEKGRQPFFRTIFQLLSHFNILSLLVFFSFSWCNISMNDVFLMLFCVSVHFRLLLSS
jgi:hypothetical protein